MTNHLEMRDTVEVQVSLGRKYKSRKERPCDACRKRKICCTRDAYEKDCSLCKTRGESCKYVLPPNVRRNRQASSRTRPSTSGSSSTTERAPRTTLSCASTSSPRPQPPSNEWICQFVGLSGDQDPFVLRHYSFNHQNCYKAPDWAVLRVKGESEIPLHFTVVPDTHLDPSPSINVEAIVSPNSDNLLKAYFDVIHASYPLLEPSRFTTRPQKGDTLVAAMYQLASPFCPETPSSYPQLSTFLSQSLSTLTQHPRLENLEASLLALNLPTTNPSTAHSTLGSLIGTSHSLGLNLDATTWALPPNDIHRRLRLWWSLHINDKFLSLLCGRPSYLNPENVTAPLPTLASFPLNSTRNGPQDLIPALTFISLSHLSVLLSDILSTFYTLSSTTRLKLLPVEMLFSLLSSFQSRLQAFHSEHLYQFYNPHSDTVLNNCGTVILSYYTCEIVVYRAVLRYLPMNHLGYSGVREQAKTCVLRLISFLESLSLKHLQGFWWNPISSLSLSLAGSFLFSLLLTSLTPNDIDFYSTTSTHYRSLLLSQHSNGFTSAKTAILRLDLMAGGLGIDAESSIATPSSAPTSNGNVNQNNSSESSGISNNVEAIWEGRIGESSWETSIAKTERGETGFPIPGEGKWNIEHILPSSSEPGIHTNTQTQTQTQTHTQTQMEKAEWLFRASEGMPRY